MGICFQRFSFFLTLAFDISVQLTATLLHVLACAEPSDFSALRDPLIKVGALLTFHRVEGGSLIALAVS